MKMKKDKLKISDVAQIIGVKKSIIRQWETELNLKMNENLYTEKDVNTLTDIKKLIKIKGLSIEEVKSKIAKTVALTLPATKYVEAKKDRTELSTQPITKKNDTLISEDNKSKNIPSQKIKRIEVTSKKKKELKEKTITIPQEFLSNIHIIKKHLIKLKDLLS